LKRLRPDLKIVPLRGNVNTRLAKLDEHEFDAIILAAAGLERLELAGRISQQFTPEEMLPAAAQGVIGLECVAGNKAVIDILGQLHHAPTGLTTVAERAIARVFGASCQSPVAAHAQLDDDEITISALVALPDGSEVMRKSLCGAAEDAAQLGEQLARRMLGHGAREILDRADKVLARAGND
jgi:hydroxymethylbilane synthase